MGRIPRWRLGAGIFHVYNRSINMLPILNNDEEKDRFSEILKAKLSTHDLNVYHYCVMGNHFHLAVEALDIRALSSFVSGLSSSYSKYFRVRHHAGYGPLWQGRYKSILVQKESYLFRLGRYIEQNPVRAGLVGRAGEWAWSSARSYLTGVSDGIVEPDRHPYLPVDYETQESRRQWYLEYLQEFPEDDLQIFRSDATVIGDDNFKGKVLTIGGRKQIRRGRPTNICQ